jgi:hypothetical protein
VFFLVRKSRESALRELYEGKLAERERLVQLLIEQVEFLRAQGGMATASVRLAAGPSVDRPLEPVLPGVVTGPVIDEFHITDEEDELTAMHTAGVITDLEFQQGLDKIRSGQVRNIIE